MCYLHHQTLQAVESLSSRFLSLPAQTTNMVCYDEYGGKKPERKQEFEESRSDGFMYM